MFLLDRFFDGTFFTYGIEVMSFADRDQEDRIDPMIYVFPRYSIHNLDPGFMLIQGRINQTVVLGQNSSPAIGLIRAA